MSTKTTLKIVGLLITAFGLALSFADKKGWLKDRARAQVLKWVLKAPDGLSLESAAGKAFRSKFPPPANSSDDFTHVTKQVIKSKNGPVIMASVNYMHRSGARTAYVATLDDVRSWAGETRYRWLPWFTTLLGFVIVVVTLILELLESTEA
jgi:hypothetical protein